MSAHLDREALRRSLQTDLSSRPLRHVVLCALALGAMTLVNPARAETTAAAAPACTLAGPDLGQALTRTRFQLTHGRSLKIVAIGSSSTEGAGASSPGSAHPARLEALLNARFAGVAIRVLNRGIGGEEEADMLARFDRAVIAEKPDLVLWQGAAH